MSTVGVASNAFPMDVVMAYNKARTLPSYRGVTIAQFAAMFAKSASSSSDAASVTSTNNEPKMVDLSRPAPTTQMRASMMKETPAADSDTGSVSDSRPDTPTGYTQHERELLAKMPGLERIANPAASMASSNSQASTLPIDLPALEPIGRHVRGHGSGHHGHRSHHKNQPRHSGSRHSSAMHGTHRARDHKAGGQHGSRLGFLNHAGRARVGRADNFRHATAPSMPRFATHQSQHGITIGDGADLLIGAGMDDLHPDHVASIQALLDAAESRGLQFIGDVQDLIDEGLVADNLYAKQADYDSDSEGEMADGVVLRDFADQLFVSSMPAMHAVPTAYALASNFETTMDPVGQSVDPALLAEMPPSIPIGSQWEYGDSDDDCDSDSSSGSDESDAPNLVNYTFEDVSSVARTRMPGMPGLVRSNQSNADADDMPAVHDVVANHMPAASTAPVLDTEPQYVKDFLKQLTIFLGNANKAGSKEPMICFVPNREGWVNEVALKLAQEGRFNEFMGNHVAFSGVNKHQRPNADGHTQLSLASGQKIKLDGDHYMLHNERGHKLYDQPVTRYFRHPSADWRHVTFAEIPYAMKPQQ